MMELFINGKDKEEIMQEIIKELTAQKHVRNRLQTGTNLSLESRGTEVQKKVLDEMKSIKTSTMYKRISRQRQQTGSNPESRGES